MRIVDAYDLLMRLAPSPIHALNRAIAITQRDGPARGLAELDRISADQALKRYYLWHAVRADFLIRLGQTGAARRELEQAVALTVTDAERRLLVERLNRLAGLDDSRSEASESKSRRS